MNIRRFKDKSLADYLIVNNSGSTRSGFYHDSTLIFGDIEMAHYRAHYLNRTWECYTFQTSMMGAVREYKRYYEDLYLDQFKRKNNYKKLTAQRKAEFEEFLNKQEKIIISNKMLEELKEYHC